MAIAASPKMVPIRDSGHGFSSKGSLQQSSRSVSRFLDGPLHAESYLAT